MPRVLVILLLLAARAAGGGIDEYRELVRPTAAEKPAGRDGIRVTYLGVNGYRFDAAGHTLLVDPYFTRVNLAAAALDRRIAPNPERVGAALRRLPRRVDAVLVTHAHFDHLLDVPLVMRRTGARLFAGPTAVNLASSCGAARSRLRPVAPGALRRVGPWTIRVLSATHDRLLGSVPFPGQVREPGPAPERVSDWVLGEPLAFLVEAVGQRIYVDSGGVAGELPPPQAGRIDLAIVGVALPASRQRLAPLLRRLRPRYVLPSHQDDFFAPLERGFRFGKLTDFPRVRRTIEADPALGRLILLDYFQPWTLR